VIYRLDVSNTRKRNDLSKAYRREHLVKGIKVLHARHDPDMID
jgi:hypothetical protein